MGTALHLSVLRAIKVLPALLPRGEPKEEGSEKAQRLSQVLASRAHVLRLDVALLASLEAGPAPKCQEGDRRQWEGAV